MTYSTNSKTLHFSSWKFMCLILTLSLVLGYASTVRSMATTKMKNSKEEASGMFSEPLPDYGEKKEFLKSNWFHMLPKGVPIPPSAPSPRCNSC
ncbi:hypothetical protein RND71_003170 [Anisodus tanguticus]|uniref:Uncharacterized protein n=1 Tax=Anisodus tanguticus TaxID=243964 RepID=A0AAE1SU37_9SOLA|nr:hypothetical protein RND71_003170 [Anisodus tanguticus]